MKQIECVWLECFELKIHAWSHQAKLVAPDGSSEDSLGRTVGIYGKTVIIGAHNDDNNREDSGSTHVFIWNGVTWTSHAKLLAPKSGEQFGQSVDTYNGTVIVGSGSGKFICVFKLAQFIVVLSYVLANCKEINSL